MLVATSRRSPNGSTQNGLGLQARSRWGNLDWYGAAAEDGMMGWMPPVELRETDENFQVSVELPGVDREDVSVSIENNALTIRGEKRAHHTEGERVHRSERPFGQFVRRFPLSATLDLNGIAASYDVGVLTVTLPKAEQARPRTIPIQIS